MTLKVLHITDYTNTKSQIQTHFQTLKDLKFLIAFKSVLGGLAI